MMTDSTDTPPHNGASPETPFCESPSSGENPAGDALPEDGPKTLFTGPGAEDSARNARIIEGLKSVYDPEIPVDIWELGLVYRIDIDADGHVALDMTLTAPNCPVAEELPQRVRNMVEVTEGVSSCTVALVWEPFWRPDMMSEVARLQLDMFS